MIQWRGGKYDATGREDLEDCLAMWIMNSSDGAAFLYFGPAPSNSFRSLENCMAGLILLLTLSR